MRAVRITLEYFVAYRQPSAPTAGAVGMGGRFLKDGDVDDATKGISGIILLDERGFGLL